MNNIIAIVTLLSVTLFEGPQNIDGDTIFLAYKDFETGDQLTNNLKLTDIGS